jgi:hypothetical protein
MQFQGSRQYCKYPVVDAPVMYNVTMHILLCLLLCIYSRTVFVLLVVRGWLIKQCCATQFIMSLWGGTALFCWALH